MQRPTASIVWVGSFAAAQAGLVVTRRFFALAAQRCPAQGTSAADRIFGVCIPADRLPPGTVEIWLVLG